MNLRPVAKLWSCRVGGPPAPRRHLNIRVSKSRMQHKLIKIVATKLNNTCWTAAAADSRLPRIRWIRGAARELDHGARFPPGLRQFPSTSGLSPHGCCIASCMAQSSDQIGMNTSWSSAAPSLTAKASGHKVAVVLPLHGCGSSSGFSIFGKLIFLAIFQLHLTTAANQLQCTAFVARQQSSAISPAFPANRSWLLKNRQTECSLFKKRYFLMKK